MPVMSFALWRDFAEALGPDFGRAERVTIEIAPNELVTVTMKFPLSQEAGERVAAALKRYDVVERVPDAEPRDT